ncbi:MAG: peptidoglycan DD-metalloendopeptidase family protein [Acidiferrobacterales bacterium]
MLRPVQIAFLVLLLAGLAGCGGGSYLSYEVDPKASGSQPTRYRTVVRGDTLFSIAWDIRVDFRTLAGWNGIRSPYVIKQGQRLRVSGPARSRSAKTRSKKKSKGGYSARYYRVKRGDTVYGIARKTGSSASNIVRWNGLRKPYKIHAGQRLRVSGAPTRTASRSTRKSKKHQSARQSRTTTKPKSVGRWVWPANGKILRRFSLNGASKGLDIGGKLGAPIRAAAGGRVVYQGSGLRGYGKLIIIKHNPDYLSAYAHSATVLVKEGSKVKRGQRIATMGNTGTDRVKLHFEIRLRGNPVNPLRYLPKKS